MEEEVRSVWIVSDERLEGLRVFSSAEKAEAYAKVWFEDVNPTSRLQHSPGADAGDGSSRFYIKRHRLDAPAYQPSFGQPTLETELSEIVSVRVYRKLLTNHGIRTVGDLVRLPLYQLWLLKGVGERSIAELLTLAQDVHVSDQALRELGDAPSPDTPITEV